VTVDDLALSKLTNTELDRRARLYPDDRTYLSTVLRVLDERKSENAETTRVWIRDQLKAVRRQVFLDS